MVNTITTDLDSTFTEGKSTSELVKGADALNNMILNLFKTSSQLGNSLGQRPYENTYGCNLEKYLFEPLDLTVAIDIKDELYDAITTFLPEFYVTRSSIIVSPMYDEDAYRIYIAYVYLGDAYDLSITANRKARRN